MFPGFCVVYLLTEWLYKRVVIGTNIDALNNNGYNFSEIPYVLV